MRKLTIALLLTLSTGCAVYRAHSAPLAVHPKDAPTREMVDRCYEEIADPLTHRFTFEPNGDRGDAARTCVVMETEWRDSRPFARFLLKLREHFPWLDAGQDEGAMH